MTDKAFNQTIQPFRLLVVVVGCILSLLIFSFPGKALAEDEMPYDEVSVFFNVAGLGGKEVEAIIKNEQVYLSVSEVFEHLKINNQLAADLESVSGFFLFENNRYMIDKTNNKIILGEKTFPLNPDDLIQTTTGIYLHSEAFGKIFGLDCIFNFRSLSITLNTKLDLPVIREKRQEMMRNNISKLKREIKADTTISRTYQAFNLGAFNWAVHSTQPGNGLQETRLNLRLGTVVAGGETNIALNYDTRQDISMLQQNFLWRYADNGRETLRQIMAGKIPVQSVSSLYAPVLGVQLTNTPTTYRRSFGNYTLSDFTEPEWIVELYVNNVLVDYVKSDASGFFSFEVPLVYGNTSVKLRFFGPWGEERFKEEKITVPYNFLPKNELEYTLSAGMLEDGKQSRFSRLDLKYGLGKRITAGAGVEYLSRLTSGQMMPFVNASVRLGSALLLSADYTYGVRGKAMLNYRMPANLLLELSYTRYQQDQQAIWQNFLEEHKVMISKPFRNQKVSGFSRLSINQVVYPNVRHTTADLLLSASLKGVSANLSTYAQMISTNDLNIYSNLAIAFSLPSRFTLRPQLQYGYTFQRVNEIRAEIEKHIFNRGFLNISYQNNLNYNTESLTLGLRFDLNFARASFSFRQSSNRAVFSQALSGGGLIDAESRYFKLNNRSNVGRGGLVIYPFLDLNRNNRRDRNEPKIEGLELKINGGRVQHNLKDTTVQIFDLEPYSTYLLELSRSSFDNIAWQLKNAAYKVTVEPNKLKLIEVPVMVSGEVSGMIYGSAADSTGQGRIIINFYGNGALAGHTLSESDGYINFLGLAPGAYTARIDSAQLKKLKMTAAPDSMVFTVALSADGDIVSDINFKLQDAEINEGVAPVLPASSAGSLSGIKIAKDINSSLAGEKSTFSKEEHGHRRALPKFNYVTKPIKKPIQGGTTQSVNRKSELMPEANLTSPGNNPADGTLNDAGFTIRINAVGDRSSAVNLKNNLMIQYGHAVRIYFEGSNAFELSIGGFKNRKEAEEFLPLLVRHGLKNAHIMAPRGLFKTANPGARVAFQLTAGRASNTTDIRQAQERIMRTLNKSSFPVKDGDTYRLLISGFTDSVHAAQAQQKLVAAGLEAGFITDYKETVIDLEPSIPALTGNRGFIPSKIPGHSADSIIPRNPVSGSQTNINPSQEDVIRFRVVTEKFSDPNIIRQNQELILKTLERPAYPVKDGNYFRLHISGFKDLKEADAAYQKLIQAGLNTGYITRYRERVVHIRGF